MHTVDSQVSRRSAPQPSLASTWIVRLVAATLLVVAYFTAWQSVRTGWSASVAYPVLSGVAKTSEEHHVSASGRNVVVIRTVEFVETTQPAETTRSSVASPPGVKFLLPAIFLLLVAPFRPLWLYFGVGHLALSTMAVGSGVVLILSPPVGDPLLTFVQSYLVDVYSLTVPILAYARHRIRRV
jgi:hypothetical protein